VSEVEARTAFPYRSLIPRACESSAFEVTASTMGRCRFCYSFFLLTALFLAQTGCEYSPSSSQKESIPPDLQATVDTLVHAVEKFDVPRVLTVYADDFMSGTGRSKEGVGEIFAQLHKNHVSLAVEGVDIEEAGPNKAKLRTRLRLRYTDRFRNVGEGEVVVTDILVHSLRKDANGWKIYTDQRVASYRDGRFGRQPPNVAIDLPEHLPTGLEYPIRVSVRREADRVYQVMIGNYAEDPGVLPPPDIITMLPDNGVIKANLIPNPQGVNEMVRVTVIVVDATGDWLGATTISKLVPGAQRQPPTNPKKQHDA
jgi:hypothetical protein